MRRCKNCETFFDPKINYFLECPYHPGRLNENYWSCCTNFKSSEGCFFKLHESKVTKDFPFIHVKKPIEPDAIKKIFSENPTGTVLSIAQIPEKNEGIGIMDVFHQRKHKEKLTQEVLTTMRSSDKDDVYQQQELENLKTSKHYCHSSNTHLLIPRSEFIKDKNKEQLLLVTISTQFLFCW